MTSPAPICKALASLGLRFERSTIHKWLNEDHDTSTGASCAKLANELLRHMTPAQLDAMVKDINTHT